MADVRLNPEQVVQGGLTATYTSSLSTSNTYKVRNDGRVVLHFKKTGAGACDVTLQTPVTVGGLAVSEQVVQVPATTGDKFVGPFPTSVFNDGNQDLNFTLSEITGLSVAVLRV